MYEATLPTGQSAYFSLTGEAPEIRSGDPVLINGLYAAKLGIKDSQEVLLQPVLSPPLVAQEVHVEPLTVDDWEILVSN